MSIEAEADLAAQRGRLKLNFKVAVASLEVCHPKIIPVWTWRGIKNEKFGVHIDAEGNIRQWKVGTLIDDFSQIS